MHPSEHAWIKSLDAEISPHDRGRLRALRLHAGPDDVDLIDRLLSPPDVDEGDAFARGAARAARPRDDIRHYPAPTNVRI